MKRSIRVTPFLWMLVPGAGQVHQDHPLRGLFLFTLFALLANAAFIAPIVFGPYGREVRLAGAGGAIVVWILSALDFFGRDIRRQERFKRQQEKAL